VPRRSDRRPSPIEIRWLAIDLWRSLHTLSVIPSEHEFALYFAPLDFSRAAPDDDDDDVVIPCVSLRVSCRDTPGDAPLRKPAIIREEEEMQFEIHLGEIPRIHRRFVYSFTLSRESRKTVPLISHRARFLAQQSPRATCGDGHACPCNIT